MEYAVYMNLKGFLSKKRHLPWESKSREGGFGGVLSWTTCTVGGMDHLYMYTISLDTIEIALYSKCDYRINIFNVNNFTINAY